MINDKNTCSNCKHFLQHYVWRVNKYFTTNCGHCYKKLIDCKSPYFKCCKDWELKTDEEVIKHKESLKQTLLDMAKKVDEIIVRLDHYDNK